MSPLALIEAVATLLWCYAVITVLAWAGHLQRSDRHRRAAHGVDLIANLVPATIAVLLVAIAGALLDLPSVAIVIAVLLPAGLAFGLHMSLNDIRDDAALPREVARIALAFVIGLALIWWRQPR